MWFFQLLLFVVSTVLSYLLTPKPHVTEPKAKPLTGAPIADASAPVPVLFGTRRITQPNCVWWGHVRVVPVKTKSGKK